MGAESQVFNGDQCRALEHIFIEEHGVPGIRLMHRAGRFVYESLLRHWPDTTKITIFCGNGNNAGDGYIVAGFAHDRGLQAQVIQIGDLARLKGDAKRAYEWMRQRGVETQPPGEIQGQVVVDALLGTGAVSAIRPNYQKAIDQINNEQCPVIAIDLPSGVSVDTGALLTPRPVRASVTATFVGDKIGLRTGAAVDFVGQIEITRLGAPQGLYAQVDGLDTVGGPAFPSTMPPRRPGAHKNDSGHVLVIGGDSGMGGAALLTATAALRSGAGLVSACTRPLHVPGFLARLPEVMVLGTDDAEPAHPVLDRCTVVAIGPGLGRSRWSESMLQSALQTSKPLVIDADGLNLVAELGLEVPSGAILTPHPGEAARLLGISNLEIMNDRLNAAAALSEKFDATVVLKGAGSLIACGGAVRALNPVVNADLGTAGSGDVLTGICAAALGQGLDPLEAAVVAVHLHSRAACDAALGRTGLAITATDLLENIRPWLAADS